MNSGIPSAGEWNHNVDWFGNAGYPIPPANALVRYPDGSICPLMFYYLPAEVSFHEVADQNGFEFKSLMMEADLPDDDPIFKAYFEDGDPDAGQKWKPPSYDGWQFVGIEDSEDGPFAMYLRPKQQEA